MPTTQDSPTADAPRGRIVAGGLKANLAANGKETLRLWVDDAPLRLVAAALLDANRQRKAQTQDVREALTAEVIPPENWDAWWKRVQQALKEFPKQFEYTPSNRTITLKVMRPSDIEPISFGDLPMPAKQPKASKPRVDAATKQAHWLHWILSRKESAVIYSETPPPALMPFLTGLQPEDVSSAVDNLTEAIERRFLGASRRPAAGTRRNLLAPLGAILERWIKLGDTVPRMSLTALQRIIWIAASNVDLSGNDHYDGIVNWLIEYASENDDSAGLAASGLLRCDQESATDVSGLLIRMLESLSHDAKIAIWRQLVMLSGLRANQQWSDAQKWLDLLSGSDRAAVMSSMVVAARNETTIIGIEKALNLEWERAGSEERRVLFDAFALGWVLHGQLRPRAIEVMRQELLDSEINGATHQDSRPSELAAIVGEASRSEVEQVRNDLTREIEDKKLQLEQKTAELELSEKRLNDLQGEIRKRRQEAELEITGRAITVLGAALQELANSPSSGMNGASNVEARITLALSTLGVKPVGEIGETVAYDPRLHEADNPPTLGTMVKVIAPGMQYARRSDNPIDLVKIRVKA